MITRALLLTVVMSLALCAAPFACTHQDRSAAAPATQAAASKPAATKASSTKPAAAKPASRPVVAKWTPGPLPDDQVNLIIFGDFGNAKPSQKDTATAMAGYVARTGTPFNAALTVGDNFYVKMKDADDWQFQSLFEDMYDAKRLNFPYFATMGNHDYEKAEPANGKVKADLEREYAAKHPDSRWKCPARWYRIDFPPGSEAPLLTALMLESSKPKLTPDEWEREKQWIDEQLAATPARWKIACAHHPFFSNGSHGDNGIMQAEWGPIFKNRGLDFYIAGHDHDLQHLQIPGWPFSFVQAGGGGQTITDMRRDIRGPFSRKANGFVHLQISVDEAHVRYIAAVENKTVLPEGRIIHHFAREKESGAIKIVSTTGRDKATTKPLKTLLGISEKEVKPETEKK
jgi:tartrate-resistant acid phosphatase type 5